MSSRQLELQFHLDLYPQNKATMSLARSSLTARTLLARQTRLFSTSPLRASVLDTAKSTVKEADRKVSDAAVKGIEKGGMCSPPHWTSLHFACL